MKPLMYVIITVVLFAGLLIGYSLAQFGSPAPQGTTKVKSADITLTIIPDVKLASDGQMHDAFNPVNMTVFTGQLVNLTIINYDTMSHTFTSPSLGVSFNAPPAQKDGVPTVVHYQFTVSKPGIYRWWCATPCDSWAMSAGSDGQVGQIGYMGGFVTALEP
ncbi:MAG: hypothetical protein QXX17_00370 [Conexivisphaerales archaeon]